MNALNALQVTVTRIANSGENNFVKNQKIQEAFDQFQAANFHPATEATDDSPLIIIGGSGLGPVGEKGPQGPEGETGTPETPGIQIEN